MAKGRVTRSNPKQKQKNNTLISINNKSTDVKTANNEHICTKCNKKYTTSVGLKRHLKFCTASMEIPLKSVENHNNLELKNFNIFSEATTDSGIEDATSIANSQASDDSHNDSISTAVDGYLSKNPYEFEDEDEEQNHEVTIEVPKTVSDDPNICQCCGENIKTAHKAGSYKCEICVKYYKKKDSFNEHNKNFHSEAKNAIKCSKCPVVCANKTVMREHEEKHAKDFQCDSCQKKFNRKYNLDRHQKLGCGPVTEKVKAFKCQACGKEFTRRDNLMIHLRMHLGQPSNQKEFTCEYCGNKYKGRAAYHIHLRKHTGEAPFKCEYCSSAFRAKQALVKHTRRHTGEKPFVCSHCRKRFSAKEVLNRHMLIHSDDKPFSCDLCGKSFIQMVQLRAHMFHHTGEMSFKCKQCDMAFYNNTRLTTHVKYAHEGATKLRCPSCPKAFFRQEKLTEHIIIHSDEKQYSCDDCGKTFKTKQLLIFHTRTHRKEKPRICPLCPRAFIRFDCLLRHFRSKHAELYKTAILEAKKDKIEKMRNQVFLQKDIKIRKRIQTFGPEPMAPYVFTHLKEISKDVEFTNLKSKLKQKTRKEAQASRETLVKIADHYVTEDFEVEIVDIPLSESYLATSIQELLELLIDKESFEAFNWYDENVDEILEALIVKCGHTAADPKITERAQRLRENAKILLTVVIDDAAIQSLFKTQTVDEVILSVLRLGKSCT